MPKVRGKWTNFTRGEAQDTTRGRPVKGFEIEFEWHTGPWQDIFNCQLKLIKEDVARARAQDRIVVYLSCPISSRDGNWSGTNVDIARFTERRLLQEWGEGFWILNPAQYQLESKAGTGLIEGHARQFGIDLVRLKRFAKPSGGDYMRMWTRVLVENKSMAGVRRNSGQDFDAFYFLGPSDVHAFFAGQGTTLTAGVQAYFARKFANDIEFRKEFSVRPDAAWERRRVDFLRYYGVRAGAAFSPGSHDEWEIFRLLNQRRRGADSGDVSGQLAGFFDGAQIDPSAAQAPLSRGYALGDPKIA